MDAREQRGEQLGRCGRRQRVERGEGRLAHVALLRERRVRHVRRRAPRVGERGRRLAEGGAVAVGGAEECDEEWQCVRGEDAEEEEALARHEARGARRAQQRREERAHRRRRDAPRRRAAQRRLQRALDRPIGQAREEAAPARRAAAVAAADEQRHQAPKVAERRDAAEQRRREHVEGGAILDGRRLERGEELLARGAKVVGRAERGGRRAAEEVGGALGHRAEQRDERVGVGRVVGRRAGRPLCEERLEAPLRDELHEQRGARDRPRWWRRRRRVVGHFAQRGGERVQRVARRRAEQLAVEERRRLRLRQRREPVAQKRAEQRRRPARVVAARKEPREPRAVAAAEQLVYFLCCGGRGGKRERRAGVDEAEAGRKSRFGRGGRVRVGQGAQAGRRRRVEEWEVDVGRVGRHFSRSDER